MNWQLTGRRTPPTPEEWAEVWALLLVIETHQDRLPSVVALIEAHEDAIKTLGTIHAFASLARVWGLAGVLAGAAGWLAYQAGPLLSAAP